MKEILPGIFLITENRPFFGIRPTVNIYVIGGQDALVFDAGYGDRRSVKFFLGELETIRGDYKERGLPFHAGRILPSHSHPDHFSGLAEIRRKTGIKILLTPEMAGIIAVRREYRRYYGIGTAPEHRRLFSRLYSAVLDSCYERVYGTEFVPDPDELIGADARITVNGETWSVIPSPGHSRDHIALYSEARGILLAGDNVLAGITPWLGPPHSDLRAYLDTLRLYLSLPRLEIILGAHGLPVKDPADRIGKTIAWRERRTAEVLRAVRNAGKEGIGPREILHALYKKPGRLKVYLAEGWILLTLDFLLNEGLIVRLSKDRYCSLPGSA